MRDGAVLRADVHLPASAGPQPTVLLRSPYGRSVTFAIPMTVPYAQRGYAVVLQSVRGTFGSGGEFSPVVNEEHDGQDTVAWLRGQECSTAGSPRSGPVISATRSGPWRSTRRPS